MGQWDYLKKLTPIPIAHARRLNGAALLTPSERTQYLSLTAQLSWPARTTLPGLSFLVSDLQQRTAEAQVKDLVRANWILRKAQEMGRNGECLIFRGNNIPDDDVAIVGIHDASFAQQPGHSSQQGYLVLMSVGGAFTTPEKQPSMLIDWSSTKIHRVVRSTLAAEAASASHAHDRVTFVRVLIADVLFGEHGKHWSQVQKSVRYGLVTDCRSLYDHCNKTGASLSEKRVGLDIADIRSSIDGGDVLMWVPTERMPADAFTKHVKVQTVLQEVCRDGVFVDFTV